MVHILVQLFNTQKVFVPDFCSVNLINHTISSDGNIRISPTALQMQMTLNLNLFPSEMMEDLTHADDKFNRIHQNLQRIINDTVTDDVFNSMLHKKCSVPPQPFQPYFGLFSDFLFQPFFFSVAGTASQSVGVALVSKRSVTVTKKQKPVLLFARFALRLPWPSKMRMRSPISPELQPSQNRSGLSHSEGPKLQSFLNCLNKYIQLSFTGANPKRGE
jgi:hypothetical protein